MDMNFIWLSITSLILMAIAIPLLLQKVKPNRWYGIRTARTRNDDELWYRANRLYGMAMLTAGVVFLCSRPSSGTGVRVRITKR
jgi:uncharacterized membrane protein